ncbi:hypothetical protein C8T65DRAFT_730914 [Cerioporus squamosus]|nr:hypothetical protein C8T65DRAFT_730914 [Cerioporus squamosus]
MTGHDRPGLYRPSTITVVPRSHLGTCAAATSVLRLSCSYELSSNSNVLGQIVDTEREPGLSSSSPLHSPRFGTNQEQAESTPQTSLSSVTPIEHATVLNGIDHTCSPIKVPDFGIMTLRASSRSSLRLNCRLSERTPLLPLPKRMLSRDVANTTPGYGDRPKPWRLSAYGPYCRPACPSTSMAYRASSAGSSRKARSYTCGCTHRSRRHTSLPTRDVNEFQ